MTLASNMSAKNTHNISLQRYRNTTVTTDWTGSRYIGIALDWDYIKRRGHLSMPGYVNKALRQFQHAKPTAPHISHAIASQSAKPTLDTLHQTKQLLDYIATQAEAVLTYNASDMVLAIHSDASYLSKPGARSRAGGHFFLSSNMEIPPNNGAILNIAHIIKHGMASTTEAELAALYIMARDAVFIRIILMEMGHMLPPRSKPTTPQQRVL
eukprot:CCRYP_013286-RA/>CCRYP_013286-RA protein AED:0.46 eAED:0.46 QI:0/0/0/1/0/0/2/0/210